MFYKIGNIKVCAESSYNSMSIRAADIFADFVALKPGGAYGFATGGTPLGMYKALIEKSRKHQIDFSKMTTFNLDEYYPIKPMDEQSYSYFMRQNLFNHVPVDTSKINFLNGETEDPMLECKSYDDRIRIAGGIDLQILGIGTNGHIAFNEPGEYFTNNTHFVNISESTIDANARFFKSRDQVPRQAMSMGIRSIMLARNILVIASGANKAQAVADMLLGHITPWLPASILQLHQSVTVVLDGEASENIRSMLGYR